MSTNDNILEPPGTIAILGCGPLAIELALYARYLGFSVTVLSATDIAPQLRIQPDSKTPDLFATPLGLAALASQRGLGGTMIELDVANHQQWIDNYLTPLTEVDFLNGRVHTHVEIRSISQVPLTTGDNVQQDDSQQDDLDEDDFSDDTPVPPDFLVTWGDANGEPHEQQFEAIIDTRFRPQAGTSESGASESSINGPSSGEFLGLGPDIPGSNAAESLPDFYLLLADIATEPPSDAEMTSGYDRIRQLFADLCDRESLDVYANLGGFN